MISFGILVNVLIIIKFVIVIKIMIQYVVLMVKHIKIVVKCNVKIYNKDIKENVLI